MTKLSITHKANLDNLNNFSGDFSQVDCLELVGVELTFMPNIILKFKNLKILTINFTGAKDIEKYIGVFDKLEELYIFDNLNEIPNSIKNLQSLRILRLSGRFKEIPIEIGHLPNLETLHLFSEEFKLIPSTIGDLKRLKEININGNNLEALPEEIGKLTSLEHFFIGSEKIENLPDSFRNLKKLKTIDLVCDPMKSIKLKLKSIPPYLRDFDTIERFAGNNFQNDDINSFLLNWHCLKYLTLVDCRLKEFPKALMQLKKIENLDLSGNEIREIPNWISDLKCLERLVLSSNMIAEIPIKELAALEKLRSLVMYKNPITQSKKNEYEDTLKGQINNKIFD